MHRHFVPDKKEEISQLDCIIGPMRRNDEIYIHNILCVREYKKRHTHRFSKKQNTKWKGVPTTEDQSVKFHKEVMIINGGAAEDLAPFQKTTENAARKVV